MCASHAIGSLWVYNLWWPTILVYSGQRGFPGHRTFSVQTRAVLDKPGWFLISWARPWATCMGTWRTRETLSHIHGIYIVFGYLDFRQLMMRVMWEFGTRGLNLRGQGSPLEKDWYLAWELELGLDLAGRRVRLEWGCGSVFKRAFQAEGPAWGHPWSREPGVSMNWEQGWPSRVNSGGAVWATLARGGQAGPDQGWLGTLF